MPGPPLYLYRPLPFHTVGADSISARVPSPLRPTNLRVALLYFLYVRAVRESNLILTHCAIVFLRFNVQSSLLHCR